MRINELIRGKPISINVAHKGGKNKKIEKQKMDKVKNIVTKNNKGCSFESFLSAIINSPLQYK